MKFTKIPTDTFEKLQLGAGILMTSFDPSTASVTDSAILGATSGGMSFTATPSFSDFGEDIDNCPKNTMELKRLDEWEAKMSGTLVTCSAAVVKSMLGAATTSGTGAVKVLPLNEITTSDFNALWWVGDYSDHNGAQNGGFIAIKLLNSLSTGGFALTTTDKQKGKFAFEYTGHYSISAQDTVPFEIYVKAGTAEPA